ncbi:sigma factor-like helix-turn-helix DNA-binding protein [Cellulosilyticum sp. ST5]|uniref:sigma factor-like helix-turn-helix DNA-binding protein n=1 Tax=Cellulosilyticum sp. ST5 TaxID=3055805 RepID=UPI003977ABFF
MSKQIKYDKRYHNTRLLLRNYGDFKKHCRGCSESLKEINRTVEDWEQNYDTFENYLKSARRTKERTQVIVDLIDSFLKSYKQDAVNRNDSNKLLRYKVINLVYIEDNLTYEQIAERLEVDRSTVSRYHNRAINELAVLFFGVEGLKLEA